MSSLSAIDNGLQGIQKGMNGLKKNAHEIANAKSGIDIENAISGQAPGVNDVTQPLIEMKMNKLQVQASAKVVQTSLDLIGTIIDLKA